jgi:hypothetical protein
VAAAATAARRIDRTVQRVRCILARTSP